MKKTALILLLLSLTVGFLAADGGGGVSFGQQVMRIPYMEEMNIPWEMLWNGSDMQYVGGFGYGIGKWGDISGGFGSGYWPSSSDSLVRGAGFGGAINGLRVIKWPVNLSIISYTGFGGMSIREPIEDPVSPEITYHNRGYFAVMEEVTVELGLPLSGVMMPVVYAGISIFGNVIPGRIFESAVYYTPVWGFRMAWGSFN